MWINACEADKIKVGTCVRNKVGGYYTGMISGLEDQWLPPLTEGKVVNIRGDVWDVDFFVGNHDAWWIYDADDLYDLEVWSVG